MQNIGLEFAAICTHSSAWGSGQAARVARAAAAVRGRGATAADGRVAVASLTGRTVAGSHRVGAERVDLRPAASRILSLTSGRGRRLAAYMSLAEPLQ